MVSLKRCISEDAFANLPKLEILTLNNNNIRRFSQEAFPNQNYQTIKRIAVSGNHVSRIFYTCSYFSQVVKRGEQWYTWINVIYIASDSATY